MLHRKPLNQKTILIIDDDYHELVITRTVLTEAGFRVLLAEDGETGFNRAVFAKPDLIVLDVMMPGLDGYEIAGLLKGNRRTKDIPIIFKTCLNSGPSFVQSISSDVDDYIVKPCNHEDLVQRINALLQFSSLEFARSRLLELQAS